MKDIEIAKVLYLAKSHKYEIACASFEVVDAIRQIDVPRGLKSKKLAVQALNLLADGAVRYGYENKFTSVEEAADSAEEE